MREIAAEIVLYADFIGSSVTRLHVLRNPLVRLVFLRQIYFTAVRSVRLVFIVALTIGAAFVAHMTNILGNDERLFDLVDLVLVRNIAPLAAAVIVIGRSATAISSELALMRYNGEIDALRCLRIPINDYLVVPRVAAVTLSTMGCCFLFQVVAVVGGFAVSAIMLDVNLEEPLRRFAERVFIEAIALEVVKWLCFGFLIGAIACGTGLNSLPRMTETPFVPARAFLRASLAVIAVNLLFLLATWNDVRF